MSKLGFERLSDEIVAIDGKLYRIMNDAEIWGSKTASSLIEASAGLYEELASKKFKRDHHEAYLSCFINVGVIDKFLTAFEENSK